MIRFGDAIDRLFEELVHEAWRGRQRQSPPPELPAATALEVLLPIPGSSSGDVGFSTEGRHLTVTGDRRHAERIGTAGTPVLGDQQGHFQQTVTLSEASELAVVEARFEPEGLRLCITLRSSSGSRKS